jgi:O-antigen ligase
LKNLPKLCAFALFAVTVATIAVMWVPAFWSTALPEVAALCLAGFCLIFYIRNPKSVRLSRILIPFAVAALWPMLQLAAGTTIYPYATSVSILYWATGAAIVFAGLQAFADDNVREWYLRALVLLGLVIAIIAPLQLFTAEGKIFWFFEVNRGDMAMGPFVYANQYAAFIELVLPVALTKVFSDRAGWRTAHGLAAAVMYASIFASTSRTGFILTSLEIVVIPLLAAKRIGVDWRQLALSGALFLSMLIAMGLAVGPDRLISKLHQRDPYFGRREYAESSLRMIPDHPFMGVGLGNWPAAYPAYAIFDEGFFANQAHNDWAQWTVEGGLPFLLFIFSIALWCIPRALRTGWGIGIIVVFLQCLVDYPIQRMGVAVVFFTMIAAIPFPDDLPAQDRRASGLRRRLRRQII